MSGRAEQSRQISAITVFVENVTDARRFYCEVFDLPVHYEDDRSVVFRFGSTLVNLLDATVAGDLIAPACVAPFGIGSQFELTIEVDDVDAACAELNARGVTILNGPQDRPWGVRTAGFADPDGHIWEIAQDLP